MSARCTCGVGGDAIVSDDDVEYHSVYCAARVSWLAAATPSANKYGSLTDVAERLRPDEPWFLVRAQDLLAPSLVQVYAEGLRKVGREEQAAQVEALGIEFLRWQAANRHAVKLPD